jgi:hypothetical protein
MSIQAMTGELPPVPPYPAEDQWMPIGVQVEADAFTVVNWHWPHAITQQEWDDWHATASNQRLRLVCVFRYDVGFNRSKRFGFCRELNPVRSAKAGRPIFTIAYTPGYEFAE